MNNKTTLILVTALLACAVPATQASAWNSIHNEPRIDVSGSAEIKVTPDTIIVSMGIETHHDDIEQAKRENQEILNEALAAVDSLGIKRRQVQTDDLSINPRYEWKNQQRVFLGYLVRNTLIVTLSHSDQLEPLISEALVAGVNYLHSVDFQSSQFKQYREQARTLAMKAAKEKAIMMTDAIGQSIGRAINIQEGHQGSFSSHYYSSWFDWGRGRHGSGRAMMQNIVQDLQQPTGDSGDAIALGQISVRASVRVTFQLNSE